MIRFEPRRKTPTADDPTEPAAGQDGALLTIAVLALWVFCNPFHGSDSSSLIYLGRALADLDPAGVGQDVMFRLDGQSGFTLFTPLFDAIARLVGLSTATVLIAAASVLTSFIGACVLATAIAADRLRYLMIAFAAALPACYGGYTFFSYAETAATPRPFTEAIVLCGLAALLKSRFGIAIVLMAVAALLHPIMVLPGLTVLFIWLVTISRRWALIMSVALATALAALMLIPTFHSRMTTFVDPAWRAILVARTPYLFPSLWVGGWMGRAATVTATLLIAAHLVSAPVRKLFLLSLFAGYAGLAVSYVLGEKLSWLFILQIQPWRMTWLMFALGTMAAAICVWNFWPRETVAKIVLLLLASAWAWADYPEPAMLLSTAAIGVYYGIDSKHFVLRREVAWSVLGVLGVLFAGGLMVTQFNSYAATSAAPAGFSLEARRTLALAYDYMPLVIPVAAWAIFGKYRLNRFALITGTAAATLIALVCWDQRGAADRYFDSGAGATSLNAIVASKPGAVYWIYGLREPWWWLHRPNWVSAIQGASIVFSRDLAMIYDARARTVISLGLADQQIEKPFEPATTQVLHLTRQNVGRFCAARSAPAWIIAPLNSNVTIDPDLTIVRWTAPITQLRVWDDKNGSHWDWLSDYAVVRCAP